MSQGKGEALRGLSPSRPAGESTEWFPETAGASWDLKGDWLVMTRMCLFQGLNMNKVCRMLNELACWDRDKEVWEAGYVKKINHQTSSILILFL